MNMIELLSSGNYYGRILRKHGLVYSLDNYLQELTNKFDKRIAYPDLETLHIARKAYREFSS